MSLPSSLVVIVDSRTIAVIAWNINRRVPETAVGVGGGGGSGMGTTRVR